MNHLILYIGLPGSGKSTHAKDTARLFRQGGRDVRIFSSDAIREEIYGDANIVGNAGEVFGLMENRLFSHFSNDPDSVAIYDATNLSAKGRKGLIERIRHKFVCFFECRFMACRISECKRRQFSRDRKVPEEVIERMVRQFQAPYYNEGWDKILIVEGGRLYDMREEHLDAWSVEHDNPHHALSIGKHMAAARDAAVGDMNTVTAAYHHDIGKSHVKSFTNMKGEPAEFAHFYSHDNVGSYMWLSSHDAQLLDGRDAFLIGALIQWHMMPYFLKENTKEELFKWGARKGFKPEFLEGLWAIHQADQAAH